MEKNINPNLQSAGIVGAVGPLSGLRVLDVGRYVSAPYRSKLLADFGAEVIKIESPNGGDISRCCGPFPGDASDPERSGLFLHLNTNKKSIMLDWQSEAGGEILQADVLVENYDPGVLDCQSLRELNPSLILTSISYFGQDGPYHDYKGADIVAQAVGGIRDIHIYLFRQTTATPK